MALVKANKKHKIGNMIGALCMIADGLCLFFSLGNWVTNLQLNWNMFRRSTNKFYDKKY